VFITQDGLGSALGNVFEPASVALDRGSEPNLFASTLFASHGFVHSITILFLLQAALFLLQCNLNFRFLLGCLMSSWLKDKGREVEVCLDSREVFEDELLRSCLVNLAVGEANDLQFVHSSVEISLRIFILRDRLC